MVAEKARGSKAMEKRQREGQGRNKTDKQRERKGNRKGKERSREGSSTHSGMGKVCAITWIPPTKRLYASSLYQNA